ncbi:MAG: transporter substrate-binding domain-containing protein [Acidobacteria bacterium]|nr:transporter substrate-binding domain-containing protein [Acidobacteriota bacterium]
MTRRHHRTKDRALVAAGLWLLASLTAPEALGEAPAEASADRPLIIGTKVAPPFAFKDEAGRWQGMSIDLWRAIALDLGLEYELRELPLDALMRGVEDGTLDAGVAALTITAQRERRVDFSHPFYTSGLGIATLSREASWWDSLRGLVSPRFLQVIVLLVLILLVAGALVWLFERRRNPEHFGGSVLQGLGNAFWWSAVTMTTVGYGDRAPASLGGRLVALIWMFASVIVISSFTAAIASSLTVDRLGSRIEGPDDLPRIRVATVAGTTSADHLDSQHIVYRSTADLDEALTRLSAGEVDAVVYDAPILLYRSRLLEDSGITVLPGTFVRQDYGFALPQGSPLRELINRSLLEQIRGPEWRDVLYRYLGRGEEGG